MSPLQSKSSPRPRSRPRAGRVSLALAIAAAAILALVGAAGAGASSSAGIEQVWSFDGGAVVIQPEATGTGLEGVVTNRITFAECPHPVGQQMWTHMTLQPDGSYDGFHQWYFQGVDCTENPEPGRTAWRVMDEPNGSRYLRVCLSEPGKTQPQPVIAPNGTATGDTYGCIDSMFLAPSPVTSETPGSGSSPGSGSGSSSGSTGSRTTGSGVESGEGEKEVLTFLSAKQCLSARRFQIHLREPRYDPFKTVSVTIAGHRVAVRLRRRGYAVATVDLTGLERGRFTVTIHVTTVLGHHLSGTRSYHTCAKKAIHSKPGKLS